MGIRTRIRTKNENDNKSEHENGNENGKEDEKENENEKSHYNKILQVKITYINITKKSFIQATLGIFALKIPNIQYRRTKQPVHLVYESFSFFFFLNMILLSSYYTSL